MSVAQNPIAVDRLEWLVTIAQLPPRYVQTLDDAALRALGDEFWEFVLPLSGSSLSKRRSPKSGEIDLTTGEITAIDEVHALREELSALTEFAGNILKVFDLEGSVTIPISPSKVGSVGRCILRTEAGVFSYETGDQAAIFPIRMAEILALEAARIVKCASDGCRRLFVKRKRAEFCSGRCSLRERTRRYREGLKPEERYEIGHAQYVKRVDREDPDRLIRPRGARTAKTKPAQPGRSIHLDSRTKPFVKPARTDPQYRLAIAAWHARRDEHPDEALDVSITEWDREMIGQGIPASVREPLMVDADHGVFPGKKKLASRDAPAPERGRKKP